MPATYAGFVDVGYLSAEGADALGRNLDANFAGRSSGGTVVMITGDLDLAEAVRQARGLGSRVLIATPNPSTVAWQLPTLADGVISISHTDLQRMLQPRPPRSAR